MAATNLSLITKSSMCIYISYTRIDLKDWWVVYKVNPYEWLHIINDVGNHESHMEVGSMKFIKMMKYNLI
jgi:hypothetical protein